MEPAKEMGALERERLISRYGRRFVAGETLFREGEAATEAFLLQDGRVRLLKRVRVAERSLMVLRAGDLFGETALVEGGLRGSTAVALTEGVALALDRETFRQLIERHPAIATRVFEQLVLRLADAEDQIEIMMLKDNPSRVVGALLKLVVGQVAGQDDGPGMALAISPVELSCRVGLDVETVKRIVHKLREQQYIRIVGEHVEIPDVEALRRYYLLLGAKEDLRGA
ncbi:MAG: Crp/Fnr family transcriptional regulator [Polyangiaceae bacterium]|nr:Crp/Fnr family transcriptional regulator [Polyangiaceae bacterium]